MHPLLATFIRLTIVVVIALFVLSLLGFVVHLLVPAIVIAALILGGLFLYNIIRRRNGAPAIRQ
jgi:hypothetical protein